MKHRKLEYFEDQLKVSPSGREVLKLVRAHAKEVMYLVNKNRPTMICWQRNKGPKFIKSVVDSGFEDDTNFIKEAEGVKMETIIFQMAEVMQDNGSPELKFTIGKYTPMVIQIVRETHSLREVINRINTIQNMEEHG